MKEAANREAKLVCKADEDAKRIEQMQNDIRALQVRAAAHQRVVDGNRAMITALHVRCEAADLAQERAERAGRR